MKERWRAMTPMYTGRSYTFEVNIGQRCNMRCKFCFEARNGYTGVAASKDDLSYFASYMRYVKDTTNLPVSATIYGGEPTVHMDTLVPFVMELADFAAGVTIVTNGLDVMRYEKEIDAMQSALGGNLRFTVSYNFALQDETRMVGTYDKVRDSIRWLCAKGYRVNCPVVFTLENIHRIGEVFDDFAELYSETDERIRCMYACIVSGLPFSVVKEDVLREELARIRDLLDSPEHPVSREVFFYHMIGTRRGDHKRDCLLSNVRAALGADGSIYPGYDVEHASEYAKDLLRFGYVGDAFEDIDARRETLLRTLPVDPPYQCKDCSSQCRVIPWKTVEDDIAQYNAMPNPDRCKIIQIISEYLA